MSPSVTMFSSRLFAILAVSVATSVDAQSPAVVFVHGRGQDGRSRGEVRNEFVGSFERSQRQWLGKTIVPGSDVGFVWYADAIDPKASGEPSAMCASLSGAPETDDPGDLRAGLLALAQTLSLDGPALRMLTEDTYRYLSSAATRCEADARLGVEIGARGFPGRPLIVVAHSMGGIVSFASLRQNAQALDAARRFRVDRYVTLGTQLGTALILKGILGSYTEPPIPMPRTIGSWVNFKNRNDQLAFDVRAAISVSDQTRAPRDVVIDAPGDRHAISTYLSSRQVLQSILYPWCRAHTTAGKPVECQVVEAAGDFAAAAP